MVRSTPNYCSLLLLFITVAWISSSSQTRVGVMYSVWHGYAASAMAEVANKKGLQLSVEEVIRSNGKYKISDIYEKYGAQGKSAGFLWQTKPQLGYYCIYQKRANETQGPIPDCPNIQHTTTKQAQWLTAAGVDFVVADVTNIPTLSPFSDAIQLRPVEVLFEQWLKLRLKGFKTPQIAVWPKAEKGSNMWSLFLDKIYNNQHYKDLILTDLATKKKMFFVVGTSSLDADVVKKIQSNGGRNDVIVVNMWAQFDVKEFNTGKWGFFSPCTTSSGAYTTSVYDTNGNPTCNQHYTRNSPVGTVVTVSPSYQMSYGSLPFVAPGKLFGQTLRSQFDVAFKARPDYIFISSWNEYIAQPQHNPLTVNTAFNMGLENDPKRSSLFVDAYGNEFSRDIEPTVEGGSHLYDLLSSCLRVYKRGVTTCSISSEVCCQTPPKWHNIWSFSSTTDGGDYILTNSPAELPALRSSGFKEICNPFPGPSTFCVDGGLKTGQTGPFLLLSQAFISASVAGMNVNITTTPLYRCLAGKKHFFSTNEKCEGQKSEYLLGYISTQRTSVTPRSLRRCYNKVSGAHFHSLDFECPADTSTDSLMGYVR